MKRSATECHPDELNAGCQPKFPAVEVVLLQHDAQEPDAATLLAYERESMFPINLIGDMGSRLSLNKVVI